METTFRLTRLLCLPIAIAFVIGACAERGPILSPPGTTTTFILLRHAEKDWEIKDRLRPEGEARARDLVEALGSLDITAIYATAYRRNQQTAQPLADHLGLTVQTAPKAAGYYMPGNTQALLETMMATHAGGIVVWVGNTSGNLSALYKGLGGTGTPPEAYGDMAILVVGEQGLVSEKTAHFGP